MFGMLERISVWKDGDSGVLANGERIRLARVKSPDKFDGNYYLAKRTLQHLAPEGEEINIRIVGKDMYGRKLVELSKSGRNINSEMMNRFAIFQSRGYQK